MIEEYKNKMFISVKEMAEILGISTSQAYVFIKTAPFNVVCAGKTRMIIPTNSFFAWYDSLASNDTPETVEQP